MLCSPARVIGSAHCRFGVFMMRAVAAIALAFWSSWLFNQPAFAEKRVALVMGNSAYQNVIRLVNPANDSGAMSATLKSAGFDVVELKQDLKAAEMRRALRDFADNVRDADVAIVYFAGHGIEIDGTNYVIPVDAVLERDIDAFDEAVPLDRLLTVIEPARQLRLVILDACRDNPFNKTMKRTIGSRAIGRGLAKVESTSPNTLVAFAAKAGSTASDGDGKNSPFTAALVKYLPRPGLDLRRAFGFARDDVLKATNNRQEPFIYGSLGGDDVALVPAVAAPPVAAVPVDLNSAIRRDYELAERIGTRPVWDSFINTYPSGFYADLARAQRDKLGAEAASVAATEKARAAVDEQKRLAIEGAKAAEQAKAAAQARAAEEARLAAEKEKAIENAKVVEAERVKTAAQAKAAEDARLATEKKKAEADAKAAEAERARAAAAAKADEAAKMTADKTASEKSVGPVAALAPQDRSPGAGIKADQPTAIEIPRLLQSELRRVGCNSGAVDGKWDAASQKSLALFNRFAGMKLDVKVASLDALDAIKSKPARICPLICEPGFKPDGERCAMIPTPKRDETQRPRPEAQAPKAQPEGQIVCNSGGCRPVKKGCHLGAGRGYSAAPVEVCD
jgi:Caspase domain